MKQIFIHCFLASFSFLLPAKLEAQRKTLAVQKVQVSSALKLSLGPNNEFNRIIESMDGQLIASLHETRKFSIIARSDIDALMEEQEAFSPGVIAGVDYVTIPSVDDFQDRFKKATFETLGTAVSRRTIRMSLLLKIYDTKEGRLLETANIQVERTLINEGISTGERSNQRYRQFTGSVSDKGDATDSLLLEMAKEVSLKAAQRVMDVIYPAKVLAITGKIVTLNRGDGTGIEVGQIWKIFATGEEMTDPDTGEVLGVEEIEIGKAKIISVLPKFSKGEVTENFGIEKGAVLRPEKGIQ